MIIHEVEQNSEEWFALRAGKPTASEFSKLVTSKGEPSKQLEGYAIQLAADGIAGEPVDRWEGNQWTERGHEMEDRARASYELDHPDRVVQQVGFITDDAESMGASPDSIIECPAYGRGILEIKCLKATNHIKAWMYFEKNSRMPTDYVQQTQGQMLVSGLEYNDLYFWHPSLPPLLIRSHPDDVVVAGLEMQLDICLTRRDEIMAMLELRGA